MMDTQRMTFYLILSRVRNCLCMRSQPLEALPNQLTQCVPALGPANLSFPFSTVGEVSVWEHGLPAYFLLLECGYNVTPCAPTLLLLPDCGYNVTTCAPMIDCTHS